MSQLIRAGCVLKSTLDAGKAADRFFGLHAFYQLGNALKIAVAAAREYNIMNAMLAVEIKFDFFGAYARWIVLHIDSSISASLPRKNYSKEVENMLGINLKIWYTVRKGGRKHDWNYRSNGR